MASIPAPTNPRLPRKQHLQSVSDGRHAALEILVLLEQGTQVQSALDRYLRGATLKPQDKALCTELVYGFLRAEIRIDHLLQNLLRNPKKLPREMYLALGMALYALLFLERIPAHATVDWTVGHVRKRFGETMSKVANGALRTFVRLGDAPKNFGYYCPENASPAAALYAESLFYSVPHWVGKIWEKAYGAEQRRALCLRSLKAPYTGVRVNALSPHAEEVYAALLQKTEEGETLGQAVGYSGVAFAAGRSPRSVANAPLSYWQQQGDISFQSAGSQCVMQALAPKTWTSPVWDICAGQGGKSAILLEQGIVVVLCSDVHGVRLESFTGNMQRLASAFAEAVPAAVPSVVLPTVRVDTLADAPENTLAAIETTVETPPLPQGAERLLSHGAERLLPYGTAQPCVLPDPSLLMAGRTQALQVLQAVEAACGQAIPLLAYPPAPKSKKTACDADDDYWNDDDSANFSSIPVDVEESVDDTSMGQPPVVETGGSSCDVPLELTHTEQAMDDAGQDSGELSPSCMPHAASPLALAPLEFPLVALLDACAAPPDSWAGTICIDAPCSGLGILSRRPDIRRHRSVESIAEMIQLQAQIIDAAWRALKVGGGLVYMTCTLNPAENEDQIQRLLRSNPNARLVRQWQSDHHHPWLEGMYGAYCVKDATVL